MNFIFFLIALLTVTSAGLGPSIYLLKRNGIVSIIELITLSWLLGVFILSITLAVTGIFLRELSLQMTLASGCVLFGSLGLRFSIQHRVKFSWPKPSTPIEWVLCTFLLLEFFGTVCMQTHTGLGWDGLLVWEIKARYAFLNGGSIPLEYFTDLSRSFSHPVYPLLLPMLETWIYLWLGDCDQFWVRFIFPIFYFITALVLYSGVTRFCGKKWPGLITAVMLFFLPFPVAGPWNVFAGYADLLLAAFYLTALVYFFRYQIESTSSHLALVSLLAGILPWTKQEGIILWLVLVSAVLVELLPRKKFLTAGLMLIPGLTLWLGWKIVMWLIHAQPGTDFLPFKFEIIVHNFPRILISLKMLGLELVKLGNWSLLWLTFPIALICLGFQGKKKIAAQLFICAIAPLLLIACAFILSSWPVYQSHIRTTLPRLVLQVAPIALLAIGFAIGATQDFPRIPPHLKTASELDPTGLVASREAGAGKSDSTRYASRRDQGDTTRSLDAASDHSLTDCCNNS